MWHATSHKWHVTYYMRQIPCDMWHVTCDMQHVIHYMWHMTCVVGCSKFFCCIFQLKKNLMKNVHSKSRHQKLWNSSTILKVVLLLYLLIAIRVAEKWDRWDRRSSKATQKIWPIKKNIRSIDVFFVFFSGQIFWVALEDRRSQRSQFSATLIAINKYKKK